MWLPINKFCDHCGAYLEAKPAPDRGIFKITGFEPMIFRHRDTKQVECTVTYAARPFDSVNTYKMWKEKLKEVENDEEYT